MMIQNFLCVPQESCLIKSKCYVYTFKKATTEYDVLGHVSDCDLFLRHQKVFLLGLNSGSKQVTPAGFSQHEQSSLNVCGYFVADFFTSAAKVELAVCKVLWGLTISNKSRLPGRR